MNQRVTIDHIGIAANTLDEGSRFWKLIGLTADGEDDRVDDQGVTTRFFPLNEIEHSITNIEILEPTGPSTPIGKFLENRGPGIQQLCLAVDDIEEMIVHLVNNGVRMIDSVPRKGAHNSIIAFVHPKSTGGILIELKQR